MQMDWPRFMFGLIGSGSFSLCIVLCLFYRIISKDTLASFASRPGSSQAATEARLADDLPSNHNNINIILSSCLFS